MAKLSARGRKEIARVTREWTAEERDGWGEDRPMVTVRHKREYAFMSDGKVLRKDTAYLPKDKYGSSRNFTGGWHEFKRLRTDDPLVERNAKMLELAKILLAHIQQQIREGKPGTVTMTTGGK